MDLNIDDVSDFGKFLENNPQLKDYRVEITEPGVAILTKEDSKVIVPSSEVVPQNQPRVLDVIKGPSPKIQIRKSQVHNYGIFASEDIHEGEEIEECRILRLGWRAKYHGDPVIKDYVWTNMNCKCKECMMHGPHQYIALGYGSLYNHSDEQNTILNLNYKDELMTITAKTFIPKDSEIFVNYGKNYWKIRQKKEFSNEKSESQESEQETAE